MNNNITNSMNRDWRDRRLTWRLFTSLNNLDVMPAAMSEICSKEEYDFYVKKFMVRDRDPNLLYFDSYPVENGDGAIKCALAIDFTEGDFVCSIDRPEDEWSYGLWKAIGNDIEMTYLIKSHCNVTKGPFICTHKDVARVIREEIDKLFFGGYI
jgi:hypothetical protein